MCSAYLHAHVPFSTRSIQLGFSKLRLDVTAVLGQKSQHACLARRYTSQVHLEQPTKVVSHVYDSTLFDHLDSTWRFAPGPLPGSCWLDFGVDFAFKSPLYRHIALVFFDEARLQTELLNDMRPA